MVNKGRSAGTMMGVLAGLACVIAVPFAGSPKPGPRASVGDPSDAVLAVGERSEFTAKHVGRADGPMSSRVWMTPTADGEPGMVRVSLAADGRVLATALIVGRWEATVRAVWAGDGEYDGTLADATTGAVRKVRMRIVLPQLGD